MSTEEPLLPPYEELDQEGDKGKERSDKMITKSTSDGDYMSLRDDFTPVEIGTRSSLRAQRQLMFPT
jgi:hypothetical protein